MKEKCKDFDSQRKNKSLNIIYRTRICIQIENIGHIPVDFITLSFTDSTTTHPKLVNPELPPEEQYEIELYTKGTPVFSWEGSKGENNQIGKRISLLPKETTDIVVNVYGKQGW